MQTLRSVLFLIWFYGWTTIAALVVLPAAPFMSAGAMRRWAALWMRGIQAGLHILVGLTYRIEGLENLPPEPVIIASKHQSAWETLIFHTIRSDIVIALKHDLLRLPIFGWYLRIARNIPIDRAGAARAMRSLLRDAEEAVGRGDSLLIFPEGHRLTPGSAPAYKPGVAAIYKAAGVPCVPVALNSGIFWPRNGILKRPGVITLRFLPPLPSNLERKQFVELLQDRIERATAELIESASTMK